MVYNKAFSKKLPFQPFQYNQNKIRWRYKKYFGTQIIISLSLPTLKPIYMF